jgi:hypothetical protein
MNAPEGRLGSRVGADHEPACAQLDDFCKDRIELGVAAGIQDMELSPRV